MAPALCHSDLHVMHEFAEGMAPWGPPFVIGHENAGWVHRSAPASAASTQASRWPSTGCNGCGRCKPCAAGAENLCVHGLEGPPGIGFGVDGGLAEYLLVHDPRRLVPIGDLDPVDAAPLTDAGLTPYRAVKRVLPKLTPGSSVVVIGVGGLGHLAVQILDAHDRRDRHRGGHPRVGARSWRGRSARRPRCSPGTTPQRRSPTRPAARPTSCWTSSERPPTIALGAAVVRPGGDLIVVGAAAGDFSWNFYALPYEVNLTTSFWGTLPELHEVIAMAQRGLITPHVQRFPLDEAMHAYELMEKGQLSGRAVIVP